MKSQAIHLEQYLSTMGESKKTVTNPDEYATLFPDFDLEFPDGHLLVSGNCIPVLLFQ